MSLCQKLPIVPYELPYDKTNKITSAPSKDSYQPGHPPSLIRVLAVHMTKPWVLSYPLSRLQRLWSDWADAQADPSLRWLHMPFCWFWYAAAHILRAWTRKALAKLHICPCPGSLSMWQARFCSSCEQFSETVSKQVDDVVFCSGSNGVSVEEIRPHLLKHMVEDDSL